MLYMENPLGKPSRSEEGTIQYLYDTSGLCQRVPALDICGADQISEISIGIPDTDYLSEVLSSGDIVGISQAMKILELNSNSQSELNPGVLSIITAIDEFLDSTLLSLNLILTSIFNGYYL
ncbi:hypothetical protein BB560_000764 [Smittium megazygosporum]|uniref:Uncharacterized protein n=1 Tax=Smittium megazygosporum TaxID=133381 RepID=A0A2T9ZJD5_9FUNG|nr:hypothetical protein BB560_000764 [Smittium megazygosporum]